MLSFGELYEQMAKETPESPLMDSGIDSGASQVIQAGMELRAEGETSFWDEFVQLLSNSEGVAELLGVSPEKVATWPHKIKEALSQIDQQKQGSAEDETEMAPTGDNGGIVATNQDPVVPGTQ